MTKVENKDVKLRKSELLCLVELCKLMQSALHRDDLLNTIIRMSGEMLDAEGSSLVLLSNDRTELLFFCVSGDKSESLQKVRMKAGEGVAGWVVSHGESAVVVDAQSDYKFCQWVDQQTDFQTKNILCVPLKVEDKIIGALEVVNKRGDREFDIYDLKICEAIASQAGVAIERARLIEENIKSARLAAMGQTIAGMAHCVKNIVNGLKGGEYLVNRGLEKDDQKTFDQGWGMIQKNISRTSELILDMLTYSKDRKPEYGKVDPNALIEEAVDLLRPQADKTGVKMKIIIDKEIGNVMIDQKAIYRCLVNLITNAIDACSEHGGEVFVESHRVSEDRFSFVVGDTGIGMDKTILENLFKHFFSTKGGQGTGLGLPVTHKIVKEHGGSIRVESTPGQGTIFALEIPRRGQPEIKEERRKSYA